MKNFKTDGIITIMELSERRANADRKQRFTKAASSHTTKEEAAGSFMSYADQLQEPANHIKSASCSSVPFSVGLVRHNAWVA